MDCTQIRKRLSDPIAYHAPDVQSHIRECAGCRSVYEAESVLRDSLTAGRSLVPGPDYGTAAQWIASVTSKEKKQMPSLISRPFATPARRWGFGIVAAVLAFLVLVPLPYERTVGTKLTITSPDPAMAKINVDALKSRLTERGMNDVNLVHSTDPSTHSLTYYVHGSQADAKAAFDATKDLVPAVAAQGGIELAAWTVKESGSILAQIGAQSYNFNVATSGKSDADISQEIRSQLESQGMQINSLSVNRDDTSTTMNMTFNPGGANGEGSAVIKQVTVGGGNATQAVEGKVFMPQVDKSLPVDQQVAQIKQQLAANGINNVDVTVEDGKIKVTAKEEKTIH